MRVRAFTHRAPGCVPAHRMWTLSSRRARVPGRPFPSGRRRGPRPRTAPAAPTQAKRACGRIVACPAVRRARSGARRFCQPPQPGGSPLALARAQPLARTCWSSGARCPALGRATYICVSYSSVESQCTTRFAWRRRTQCRLLRACPSLASGVRRQLEQGTRPPARGEGGGPGPADSDVGLLPPRRASTIAQPPRAIPAASIQLRTAHIARHPRRVARARSFAALPRGALHAPPNPAVGVVAGRPTRRLAIPVRDLPARSGPANAAPDEGREDPTPAGRRGGAGQVLRSIWHTHASRAWATARRQVPAGNWWKRAGAGTRCGGLYVCMDFYIRRSMARAKPVYRCINEARGRYG